MTIGSLALLGTIFRKNPLPRGWSYHAEASGVVEKVFFRGGEWVPEAGRDPRIMLL